MDSRFNFRQQKVTYDWCWQDGDTFIFQFGDGDLTDSNGDDYFIHFEYHVKDNEWIVTVWWDFDNEVVGFENSEEYITEKEIEEVKKFAEQFINA